MKGEVYYLLSITGLILFEILNCVFFSLPGFDE